MNTKKKAAILNSDEQELLESFEKGEWKRVENFKEEMAAAKLASKNHLKKKTEINI